MNYIEITFSVSPPDPWIAVLIAQLGAIGFESFVEEPPVLQAYIPEPDFEEALFENLEIWDFPGVTIAAELKMIPYQNWNAQWEADFKPVSIDDSCTIRAPFHEHSNKIYDIIIAPNMSFGTGHHETTQLMLQLLLAEDVMEKTVLDMGCGTGVIAILAEKKGAKQIHAVDIDAICVTNTRKNAALNKCERIQVTEGHSGELLKLPAFDVIYANINRNALVVDIPRYRSKLSSEGALFLSGFYGEDTGVINKACKDAGLRFEKKLSKNNWVAAKYVF